MVGRGGRSVAHGRCHDRRRGASNPRAVGQPKNRVCRQSASGLVGQCLKKRPNRQRGRKELTHMRVLLKVNMPVEAANAAAKAGKLGSTIQSILDDLKPEAA